MAGGGARRGPGGWGEGGGGWGWGALRNKLWTSGCQGDDGRAQQLGVAYGHQLASLRARVGEIRERPVEMRTRTSVQLDLLLSKNRT